MIVRALLGSPILSPCYLQDRRKKRRDFLKEKEKPLPATLTYWQYRAVILLDSLMIFLLAILLQVSTAKILRISETKLKKERFKREDSIFVSLISLSCLAVVVAHNRDNLDTKILS